MKRYNHEYFGPGDDVGGNMNEAEDGDWVRYEDHAADRAALVAQLDAAELGMHEANLTCEYAIRARDAAESQVAELTRERDEALEQARHAELNMQSSARAWQSEVTRLTEGAKKAEADNQRLLRKIEAYQERIQYLEQDSATTHAALVAQLEAEQQHSRDTAGSYAEKSEALILAETQVAELTRERDEARCRAEVLRRTSMIGALESEVTRLTEALAAAERHPATPTHAAQPATAPTVPQCRNRQPSDGGHSLAYRDGGYCDWCGAKAAQPATAPCQETAVHKDCDCEDPRVAGHGVTSQDQVDSAARKVIDWAKERLQQPATAPARTESEQRVRDLEARVERAARVCTDFMSDDDYDAFAALRRVEEALRG